MGKANCNFRKEVQSVSGGGLVMVAACLLKGGANYIYVGPNRCCDEEECILIKIMKGGDTHDQSTHH